MPTISKMQLQTMFTNVQTGIDKNLTANLTLGGVVYSPAALKAAFAHAIAVILATDAAFEHFRDSVETAHSTEAETLELYALLRSALLAIYGKKAHEALGDFGMSVPKPAGVRTVAEKAQAVARRAATRELRHTMGSRQARAVKGTIEVPNPALPTTTAPAVAPTAAPAAAKPAASSNGASQEVKAQSR